MKLVDLERLRPTVSGGRLHRFAEPDYLTWQGHLTYLPQLGAWVAWTSTRKDNDPSQETRHLVSAQPTLALLALSQLNSEAFSRERTESYRRWRPMAGEWSGAICPIELARTQALMRSAHELAISR